jgi:hypothetical protein
VPNDDASIPFYFPNTVDPARAEALVLHAAEKRGSVDFTIAAPTAWRVRGVVLNLPAPAANAGEPFAPAPRIRIVPAVASVASESAPVGLASFDRKTGAFEIPGVLPGTYDVFASFGNVHGRVSVQVAAADVENVRVTLVPDFDVNAQVNAEGFAANDIARMQIRLNPDYVGPARRLPTGLFQWRGVSAETHHTVAVDQLPEGAYVKSVRMGTLDILASGFRIGLAPEAPIEITLGTGGSISGTMEKLEPGATAFVVIVPDSPYRGRADLYRNTRTDSSGRYRISGIAPGNYHIFAWESVEEGAWRYADFIRRYEERGKAIHIDEGAIQTLQLQVIP